MLAIPGTFDTEWGREVWIDVASQGRSDPDTSGSQTDRSAADGPASHPPLPTFSKEPP